MNSIKKKIKYIENKIKNPMKGLPDEVFYFIGRNTPYINVDLLIKCPKKGILLTWRDDNYAGKGWHLPGGIIRFRETIKKRVKMVGKNELNLNIIKSKGPLEINEIIIKKQKERSHFISLLYECEVKKSELKNIKKNNLINFFKNKPKNLLKLHNIYKNYFK